MAGHNDLPLGFAALTSMCILLPTCTHTPDAGFDFRPVDLGTYLGVGSTNKSLSNESCSAVKILRLCGSQHSDEVVS